MGGRALEPTLERRATPSLWPEGFRAAACVTWDVDDETSYYGRHPGEQTTGLSELVQRSFGVPRALPHILEMLDRLRLPATFYVPAWNALRYPSAVRELSERGDEIGCHGYLHEPLDELTLAAERFILERSLEVLGGVCSRPIVGYRAPSWELNRWTPELLRSHGLLYDSSLMGDVLPYAIGDGAGSLIEVPIHWNLDDFDHFGHTKSTRSMAIADPRAVTSLWMDELQAIARWGGVFVLTLHPHISGRPGLLARVEEFLAAAKELPGIWWTTPGSVAEHAARIGFGGAGFPARALPDLPPPPIFPPSDSAHNPER